MDHYIPKRRLSITYWCADSGVADGQIFLDLDPSGSQIGKKESIADTARVLGRMFDGIEYRGAAHANVEQLAAYASVPVFNGLTDDWHPTQMLADFLTMREYAAPGQIAYADGERIGPLPVDVHVVPGAVRLLVP